MQVRVTNRQRELRLSSATVIAVAQLIATHECTSWDEVSVTFVTPTAIAALHDRLFGDPTPTDCISIPCDPENEPYRVLGDIVVCPHVALTYAAHHNLDAREELLRYVIHGFLHLVGYDDLAPPAKRRMRAREGFYLTKIRASGTICGHGDTCTQIRGRIARNAGAL